MKDDYLYLIYIALCSIIFFSLIFVSAKKMRKEYDIEMQEKRIMVSECQKDKDLPIGQMRGNCYKLFMSGNL